MNNIIKYKFSNLFKCLLIILLMSTILNSCQDNDLLIQQNFPFEVSVMPVPSRIKEHQTVEIRISLKTASSYNDTTYSIRHFQYEGCGKLQYYDEPPYLPNDEYALPQKQFRLYYTSESVESHKFSIWISDNFGNEKQIDFEFEHSD